MSKMEETADTKEQDEDMDSEDEDDQQQIKIDALKAAVEESPYTYDNHLTLIGACKEAGEFDQLRDARYKMQELFPLTEEIWLSWLQDEIKYSDSKSHEDRQKITALFEKAVKDYLSVPIWLEYIQFSIGDLDSTDGLTHIRDVCERAINHGGLHVAKGSNLWEAYRELENVILARYMPTDGVMVDKAQEDKFDAQHKRIVGLFKRQLSVPLNDMKGTLKEYKEWVDTDVDKYVMQTYNKSLSKLATLQPFEDRLCGENPTDPTHLEDYMTYLDHAIKGGEPARIQCLFERAITDNCLQPQLWLKYTQYLDKLKIKDLIMKTYERSVRNCPWATALWLGYLSALERHSQTHAAIKGVFKQALTSCVSTAEDSLQLWTQYCEYSRRRIKSVQENASELEEFRETADTGINEIYNAFGNEGDPRCSLQRYLALIEASQCNNIERSRELWRQVMSSGHGNDAQMWLEYYQLERAYGNKKHCRKLLQQALNSVREWPEGIVAAYVLFEKCEGSMRVWRACSILSWLILGVAWASLGLCMRDNSAKDRKCLMITTIVVSVVSRSLEQLEEAKSRCDAQMAIVEERRLKAAEKDAKFAETKKDKKQTPKPKTNQKPGKSAPDKHVHTRKSPAADPPQVFKVPLPILGDTTDASQPPPKKPRLDKPSHDTSKPANPDDPGGDAHNDSDPDKNSRTVFVSNLTYTIDEDKLGWLFAKCGELKDVRLVKNIKGTSKGFAYIEFASQESCEKALQMDRKSMDGRPMYVSAFKEKQQSTQFKYSTDMEKKKLFISGLPFTCTKEALETLFSQHGTVTSVRLVTYKSGAPKGLAFVEFDNETSASQAILKTDGIMIGDHTISVAISNPPSRKQPIKTKESDYVPTLGSGKKETEQRGKARTQLSMMPRAVSRAKPPPPSKANQPAASPSTPDQSAASTPSPATNHTTDSSTDDTKGETKAKMSNSDFRALLLKK